MNEVKIKIGSGEYFNIELELRKDLHDEEVAVEIIQYVIDAIYKQSQLVEELRPRIFIKIQKNWREDMWIGKSSYE